MTDWEELSADTRIELLEVELSRWIEIAHCERELRHANAGALNSYLNNPQLAIHAYERHMARIEGNRDDRQEKVAE